MAEPKKKKLGITMSVDQVSTQNPRNVNSLYDSDFTNPTPDFYKFCLSTSRKGLNAFLDLLYQHIKRRDLHIKAVCQTRKLPIAAKEYTIESEDTAKLEFIKSQFEEINGSAKEWFLQFIIDCVEANISGLSIFEINFIVTLANQIGIDNVKLKPNYLTVYNDLEDKYYFLDISKIDMLRLRSVGYTGIEDRIDFSRLPLIDLPEMKKLEVHSLDGNAGNGMLNGFVDGLLWNYLHKNYGRKSFGAFVEKHGDPPVSASYDDMNDEEGKAQALEAVKLFGRSKWTVHPQSVTFKVHDETQKAATSQLFKDYLHEIKEEITIAILGQTLTTSTDGKGSYALGNIHNTVRQDLQLADMIIITLAVNKLIKRLCDLNYSDNKGYPVFKYKQQIDIEFKKALSVIVRDLRIAGFKPLAEELNSLFGLTLEEVNAVGGSPDFEPGANKNTEEDEDGNKKNNYILSAEELIRYANEASKTIKNKNITKYLEKILEENKP